MFGVALHSACTHKRQEMILKWSSSPATTLAFYSIKAWIINSSSLFMVYESYNEAIKQANTLAI
jgi:hypothetical protein